MINEVANIKINGEAQDDLTPDIIEIELEEDVAKADVFRVRIALRVGTDGAWDHLDQDRFTIWNRLSVDAGFPDNTQTIIDGYITHIDASLSNDENDSYLEVSGMDPSCLMDLEEKQLAWPNKKDHEIAQQLFQAAGLDYEVEDTVAQHDESVSTILQTETDIQFLRRLAARNGFECFVQGGKGYFRGPNTEDAPQKLLAIQFGGETTASSLKVKVDGTPAALLEIRRVDPVEKRADTETLPASPLRQLGSRALSQLQSGAQTSRALLRQQISASTEEMKARLRNAYSGANQFVTVDGEVDGRTYQAVLRARKLVTIKGAGSNYSGLYYVTRVAHLFNVQGYTQKFQGYRNAVGLTGQEDFSAPSALPVSLPSAGAAPSSSGSRVVPPQQSGGN